MNIGQRSDREIIEEYKIQLKKDDLLKRAKEEYNRVKELRKSAKMEE